MYLLLIKKNLVCSLRLTQEEFILKFKSVPAVLFMHLGCFGADLTLSQLLRCLPCLEHKETKRTKSDSLNYSNLFLPFYRTDAVWAQVILQTLPIYSIR